MNHRKDSSRETVKSSQLEENIEFSKQLPMNIRQASPEHLREKSRTLCGCSWKRCWPLRSPLVLAKYDEALPVHRTSILCLLSSRGQEQRLLPFKLLLIFSRMLYSTMTSEDGGRRRRDFKTILRKQSASPLWFINCQNVGWVQQLGSPRFDSSALAQWFKAIILN